MQQSFTIALTNTSTSIKSPLCLLYAPQIIAGASIYLASKLIGHELTADEDSDWWELVSTRLDEIEGMLVENMTSNANIMPSLTFAVDTVFDILDLYSSNAATSNSKSRSSNSQDHKVNRCLDGSMFKLLMSV
jgi:hypothetical protein